MQDAWNATMRQHLYENSHFGMSSSQDLYEGKIMGHRGTNRGLFGCSPLDQGPGCVGSNRIFQNTKSSNC